MSLRILCAYRSFALIGGIVLHCLGCGEGGNTPQLDDAAKLYWESQRALKAGDRPKSLELLDQSIAAKPYAWSLLERGKLRAEDGNDEGARADVTAGLAIDPEFRDLQWLQEELKKPKEQRFKMKPPSALH